MMMWQVFGPIDNPLDTFGSPYGGVGDATSGPITFLSNIFRFAAVAAGIFGLVNLVIAGYLFITSSGDQQKVELAVQKINMSIIGLIVIVMSYVIAAVIGALLFGDPTFIFNPEIYGPGQP